jgi:hypothetical protein
MARSKDGSTGCSAVLDYVESFDEVEREMHERFKKRTRKQNDNERGQGIFAREEKVNSFMRRLEKRNVLRFHQLGNMRNDN